MNCFQGPLDLFRFYSFKNDFLHLFVKKNQVYQKKIIYSIVAFSNMLSIRTNKIFNLRRCASKNLILKYYFSFVNLELSKKLVFVIPSV